MQKIKYRTKVFLKQNWVYVFLITYIAILLIYSIFFIISDGENVILAPNELGDFFAGIFSPVAFLFLILGYQQQYKEFNRLQKIHVQEEQKKNYMVRPIFSWSFTPLKLEEQSIENENSRRSFTTGTFDIVIHNTGFPVISCNLVRSYMKEEPDLFDIDNEEQEVINLKDADQIYELGEFKRGTSAKISIYLTPEETTHLREEGAILIKTRFSYINSIGSYFNNSKDIFITRRFSKSELYDVNFYND